MQTGRIRATTVKEWSKGVSIYILKRNSNGTFVFFNHEWEFEIRAVFDHSLTVVAQIRFISFRLD